jgi:hypothetical protein
MLSVIILNVLSVILRVSMRSVIYTECHLCLFLYMMLVINAECPKCHNSTHNAKCRSALSCV